MEIQEDKVRRDLPDDLMKTLFQASLHLCCDKFKQPNQALKCLIAL